MNRKLNVYAPSIYNSADFSVLNAQSVNTKNYIKENYGAYKNSVVATTVFQIELEKEQYIDGVYVKYGDRVLVKNNHPKENGIYIVGNKWLRADDMITGDNAIATQIVTLNGGINNGGKYFYVVEGNIVGTDEIKYGPIQHVPMNTLNSILYNYSEFVNDRITGSAGFIFKKIGDSEHAIIIGPYVNNIESDMESVINIRGNNDIGTSSTIKSGLQSVSVIKIGTGSYSEIVDKNSSSGYMFITSFGEVSGDINIVNNCQDNNNSVDILNISTGTRYNNTIPSFPEFPNILEQTSGNIKIESGYCNFNSLSADDHDNILFDSNEFIITTSDKPITINSGNITTIKNSFNMSLPDTLVYFEGKQGIVTFTATTVISPNGVTYIQVINTAVNIDSMVIFNIYKYTGIAYPLVSVIEVAENFYYLKIYNASSSASLTLADITLSFIIF